MSAPATPVRNRRRSVRVVPKSRLWVTCLKGSMGLGRNLAVKVLDLSQTGTRLLVREPLGERQEVEVTLESLNTPKPVKLLARVVWCMAAADGGYCVGIDFHRSIPWTDFNRLT